MAALERDGLPDLWPTWSIIEMVDDEIDILGVRLRRVGISARAPGGQIVTGAAADVGDGALARAHFELLERASLVDAMVSPRDRLVLRRREGSVLGLIRGDHIFDESDEPQHWMPARSNGVALGADWSGASRSALLELVERDRLLRSWCGEGLPERVECDHPVLMALSGYEWVAARFPLEDHWSESAEVAMIIGFPQDPMAPLVRGSAAAEALDLALAKAARECLQALAFLWGEEIPAQVPSPAPTPVYHVDRFLWRGAHQELRAWLAGAHAQFEAPVYPRQPHAVVSWADLTPPTQQGRFCVAQARCDAALPLFFGQGPSWWRRALPQRGWTHPIA